ncbi:CheR family methyltransferase [Roseomonas chloroacetimidivorans]|uniref:CheR family methyltransferase n=1 Tax=Roseomonas chloroacetimidivorans TaxID=1766656 RepID=UPI003C778F0E
MLAEIEALLKAAIGLDAATIGDSAIGRAVRARQAACNLSDLEAYHVRLRESPAELQELIDTVIVPETWFFRDRGALDAMARLVREDLRGIQPVKLLSLPCSTGEEPYSMSMALLDGSIPPDRFRIDAVDISSRSIAQAQRAIYGRNAFRGTDLSFRDRHFEPLQGGFRPSEVVRRPVRFQQGNLLDPATLPPSGSQDIIFCRNVLIYFDRKTQDTALQILHRLLAPGGFLFLGPSETALPSRQDFVWMKLPMAFAFRKAPEAPATAAPPPPRPAPLPGPFLRPMAQQVRKAPQPRPVPAPVARPAMPEPPLRRPSLEEARRLADGGHLSEAVQQCEAFLRDNGPSADAFYLLGLLRDSAGSRAEAIAQYRKALYLAPHHEEALVHLSLLLEQSGDGSGARMLRERMQRSARRAGGGG